jgi:hypothetical protein
VLESNIKLFLGISSNSLSFWVEMIF